MTSDRKKVVIVGGGFGGLAAARALGNSSADVTLIDRRNHNLFQPLLYQVATAALSPADISEPIRRTLGRYLNINVVLAEVVGVDAVAKSVLLHDGAAIGYDYLVLSTGSVYNYFGHPEWQDLAPGLKSIHEARLIRQRLLLAFERAETRADPTERRALLTSVIIGGGPTGVEMAGAISELGRFMAERDFRNIQSSELRVVLIEAGPRILAAFPADLSDYAHRYLEKIGIEVRLNQRVTAVDETSISVGDELIPCGCVVWGAGTKPSPAASWLGFDLPGGKIPVDEFLRVKGVTSVFALGDTASLADRSGDQLPALAQVAKQQGAYMGDALLRLMAGRALSPFVFRNRGNTAVVGRHAAVFDFGYWKMKGTIAWLLWAFIHVALLINFEKRVLVSLQWVWRYITRQRGARLIDETAFPGRSDINPR